VFFSLRRKPSRKARPAGRTRGPAVGRVLLSLEVLEDRVLLSADTWINPNGGNWDVGSNWSLGHAPGTGDTAVINTAVAATVTIQPGDAIQVQGVTTGSKDTLAITSGSLKVTSGSSTLGGGLFMTGGSLTASGAGVKLTANGSTAADGASLYAAGGATLSLPQLTTYTANESTFQADGAGSVLDVSALLRQEPQGSFWLINATNGGTLKLNSLTQIGWGTEVGSAVITDTGNSRLVDGNVNALDGVNATLDGTDPHVADSWGSFVNGSLSITGGSYNLAGLTDVDGSSLYVSGGGSLALPGLTSYTSQAGGAGIFKADGAGSVLDLSSLTSLTEQGFVEFDGTDGGKVNLSALTSLPDNVGDLFNVSGSGGTIDLSALASILPGPGQIDISILTGGTLSLPVLKQANIAQLSNSGSLTVGGALTVQGDYTQGATGTLNVQIGGTPASGPFGQLAVQGTANLAGTFNASLVNGFIPTHGQDFKVMTFASASGTFGKVNGLSPYFTEQVNPTSLDLVALDVTPPTSSVSALPSTESSPSFTVSWSGSDPHGPGIASYDIYVSVNGGAFQPWLTGTTKTSATYSGQAGHSYGFYSIATDTQGVRQATPTAAQASTTVSPPGGGSGGGSGSGSGGSSSGSGGGSTSTGTTPSSGSSSNDLQGFLELLIELYILEMLLGQ
jgi:hypothetical protein